LPDTGRAVSPVAVVGGLTFDSLALGGYHACALTRAGTAYCWGDDGSGELGVGPSPQTCGSGSPCATAPTQVLGGIAFVAISAGTNHTCGLTAGGTAYCWGYNQQGQLGTGDTARASTPVPVSGGLSFKVISAGGFTTCGVTATGAGYCWGWNVYGMVGDSSTTDRFVPTPVAGGHMFQSIERGSSDYHTCGLTTAGAAYCWGLNMYGQLGTTSTGGGCAYACSTVPVSVQGGTSFSLLSPVAEATCALSTAGAAYCWGNPTSGVLGNGVTGPPPDTYPPGPVSGGLLIQRLVPGGNWFNCAISTAGVLYCWGDDTYGQLGDGVTASSRAIPTRVLYQP
jgi:alpha-tubulin suppressor-like RCC1 family protein